MANTILPPLDVAITAGTTRLVTLRPTAAPFVATGVWGHIFRGWRAQLAVLRARRADEVASARVGLAEGDSLRELAASEFFAELPPEPQKAVGTVSLTRPTYAAGGGVIKKGTRFALHAIPSANPAVQEAAYESSEPVYVNNTDLTVYVPVVATTSGVAGNIPRYVGRASASIVLNDVLFDTTFTVTASDAAGGSTGVTDDDLRRLCRPMYAGQWAPTNDALVAGALLDTGVKHVFLAEDTSLAQSVVFVADQSWASSAMFQRRVQQAIKTNWLGFGCRSDVRTIRNRLIAVRTDIMLADPRYIEDISDIAEQIRKALRQYFDNRSDFYTFNNDAVGGIVSRADTRIMTCTSATVVDMLTGTALSPTPITATADQITHYYLAENGVSISIQRT